MSVLHNKTFKYLAVAIEKAILAAYPEVSLSLEEIYKGIGEAPNIKMGHFCFACFPLAKMCKGNPAMIARSLAEKIEADDLILSAKEQGPYLNFFLSGNGMGRFLLEDVLNGSFFEQKLTDDPDRIMVEYSQPNTHKVMHVGHMRNLCLGNALVRMLRYAGENVTATTYPGDVGTHVAKCLWYMKYHFKGDIPKSERAEWLGEIYTHATLKLEDELGTDAEERNRELLTEILKQLHAGSGEFYDLWKETREWSVDLMKEVYDWADVKFDRWFWESEVDAPSIKYAKELFEQGKLIKDQGAVGMDLSEDKLGFCILIKSDGTGLYSTKDVELAKLKFEEFGIDRNIYVVDNRQAFHFKQVFKVLEKLGFENASKCFHLQYEMVELPDGAMSSRKGNIVPLTHLIEEMENTIEHEYLKKYLEDPNSGWTVGEVKETARMVANGAIKYGMIRIDNNRKIVFDMKEWLKLDGETGPYLQYVHARICSMCKKLEHNKNDGFKKWDVLVHERELALLQKLIQFNTVITQSVEQLKTMHVCSYLYELGKLFNSFYADCPIGKAESEDLKRARLHLAWATGEVMKQGLDVLGIPAPEKM